MEKDNKVPKTITLDPVVDAWVNKKTALLKLKGERVSDSSLINDILTEAMNADGIQEDVEHLRRMNDRQILKRTTPKIKQVARS